METCTSSGCNRSVSKPGYKLCYEHWKIEKSRTLAAPLTNILQEIVENIVSPKPITLSTPKPKPIPSPSPSISAASSLLSATKISEQLGLPRNKVNSILAELGLLNKVFNGWVATRLGLNFGAVQKRDEKTNQQYVLWSDTILTNQIFTNELCKKDNTEDEKQSLTEGNIKLGFRQKFQAGDYRSKDGHWVRSKAELLVDDWLYTEGIVHAYERKLPIEEEVYCDFYIPSNKIYIEYWGYEQKPEYLARKQEKQLIYKKYDFNLIELSDEHIRILDDYLPQMLRGFGIVLD